MRAADSLISAVGDTVFQADDHLLDAVESMSIEVQSDRAVGDFRSRCQSHG